MPVGVQALETLRVEAGVPWYGRDVDDTLIFPETRLEQLVSFTKGCYIGQEVVARVKYRGHINRGLSGLVLEGDRVPAAGARVVADGQGHRPRHLGRAVLCPRAGPSRSAMCGASTSSRAAAVHVDDGGDDPSRRCRGAAVRRAGRRDRCHPVTPNRLADETSPYLLQHAHNPSTGIPWGAGGVRARPRARTSPILLSVGYSACHWCHVMERESFENEDTAA